MYIPCHFTVAHAATPDGSLHTPSFELPETSALWRQEKDRQRAQRLEKRCQTDQRKRSLETAEANAQRLEKRRKTAHQTDQRKRSLETAEARAQRLEKRRKTDRQTQKHKRSLETAEARARRLQTQRLRQLERPQPQGLFKIATRTSEILNGQPPIAQPPIGQITSLDIGLMNHPCDYCGALKFTKETSSSCCLAGKICLPAFPPPPQAIKDLWFHNTPEAQLFRQHSRVLNNAVCLSSLAVRERTFTGYSPSVIFQGRVVQRMGPLQAEPGAQPLFAQIYVLDPSLETTIRFANMTLPASMTKHNKDTMQQLLATVQQVIHQQNPFVKDFKQILETPEEELQAGTIVISAAARPQGGHSRVYNVQSNLQELSIVTNDDDRRPQDLVLHLRAGHLTTISDLNPKAMPLHFTLLFIEGTSGWDQHVKHADSDKRVTAREFFVYHLNIRCTASDYLFQAGRLFQEWILNAWITCEHQRLTFQRHNQKTLRADSYKNLQQAVAERRRAQSTPSDSLYHNERENATGRVILASSFQNSPRWYQSKFQDAMAIVRHMHKPDLFITVTCNSHWPEITAALTLGQKAEDRPDIVARVFKQKKDQLMHDLTNSGIFGKTVAFLWVIEWQKRGLPHAHILIILEDKDRPKTSDQVDQIVCAELPPDPAENGISEVEKARRKPLWDIVLNTMIHGPCGTQNIKSPCMEKKAGRDVCTKHFPKQFQLRTTVDDKTSHPIYRRRPPGAGGRTTKKTDKAGRVIKIKGHTGQEDHEIVIDNSWVIPYNPYLSLRYNCHINVEVCSSALAAKYLYKYVTKGPDRAMVSAEVDGTQQPRDEIREYEDMRSVGSSEACWKLYSFHVSENKPPVQVLRVHLEDQQQVVFVGGDEENVVEQGRPTELTAFFQMNATEKAAKGPDFNPTTMQKYVDMPQKYTHSKNAWHHRKRGVSIGRVHTVNPLAGDVFYLRLLLHNDHCKGKTSFQDLSSINGRALNSYQAVCRELGLLSDDEEWSTVLTDAAATQLCPQIRALFVIILIFCQPANPQNLFTVFWPQWTDDFTRRGHDMGVTFTEQHLKTMVRLDLQVRLQSHQKDLQDFGLDEMTPEEKATVHGLTNIEEALIREEMDYNVIQLAANVQTTTQTFTAAQHTIYDTVMTAVREKQSLQLFISARGGCGKTFLLNALLDSVRSLEPAGCIALAMATTGIAAQLLHLGRTFHSRLKADLQPTETSVMHITAQSSLARLLRRARLLLIDEATMLHRFLLEALDRTLRDLVDANRPFGGKILILAGDFRQCLPVVPGANRAQIEKSCLNHSPLWPLFQIFHLTENMRVRASGDPRLEDFDRWTLSLGDGTANDVDNLVSIPDNMSFTIQANTDHDNTAEDRSMKDFCNMVFPDFPTNFTTPGWLEGRSLLAPTNKEVDTINDLMETWVPGLPITLSSADTLENYQDFMRFNIEYLNTLCPNGFPRHLITLKPGMPLMLLRNISPKDGLCNGTKLIFQRSLNNKLLLCTLAGTQKEVLIPRIKFLPTDQRYPFDWARRQFPIRTAFATTINKSQGQTLKSVGVWLRSPVFNHGQLYVASSRTGDPATLNYAIKPQQGQQDHHTENVVYTDVLLPP